MDTPRRPVRSDPFTLGQGTGPVPPHPPRFDADYSADFSADYGADFDTRSAFAPAERNEPVPPPDRA